MSYRGRHEGSVGVMAKIPAGVHTRAAAKLAEERLSWQELLSWAVAAYVVDELDVPTPAVLETTVARAG